MGATGSVYVEQLTAKNSVEEVMNQINAGLQVELDTSSNQKEKQAKMHFLLKSAKLMRPQEVHKKRKAMFEESEGLNKEQNTNAMDLKQAAKKVSVRFKD